VTPRLLDRLVSRSNLHAAFERVRANGGCRGSDGVTVTAFAEDLERELDSLEVSLRSGTYQPYPLLEIHIPKRPRPDGSPPGERRLAIPAVRDRVAQAAFYEVTREVFEAEMEEVSFAFRPGLGVRPAVARLQELRDQGFRFVVDADIDDFFDSIPHERLFARVHKLPLPDVFFALLARWVRCEVYDGRSLRWVERGVPQGSAVSPMLANLFLDQLDEAFLRAGKQVVRYADDFVVLCRTESEAEAALELSDQLLERLELDLERGKTVITSFDRGFKFLGAIFAGDEVYLPFPTDREERQTRALPPPLTLLRYLELSRATLRLPAAWRAGNP
jgi:RNA-directed DNA polymerase